ncbi:hypothetical protein RQP46_009679 [Phenoliferia psychrophenolica]
MSTGSVGRTVRTVLKAAQPSATFPVASTSRLVFSAAASSSSRARGPNLARCTCDWNQQHRGYSTRPSPPVTQAAVSPRKKRTILDLHALKRKKIPITVLTAHDYPSARFIEAAATTASSAPAQPNPSPTDRSTSPDSSSSTPTPTTTPRGIDICLVGDSLAMVACGYNSTTSLTLPELLFHCRSVARGCHTSLLVADMPFGTFIPSLSHGVIAATELIQNGNMDAVKIEGGHEVVDLVRRLTSVGIPVMGHEAGAFAIVLEAIPTKLGRFISENLDIPTIGIGAGMGCDGQVLVQLDMMGVRSLGHGPRFLKTYANLEETAMKAVEHYVQDVRTGQFPEEKHGYAMEDAEWKSFLEAVEALEPDADVE